MRVSAKVDYAIRACAELAAAPPGPLKREQISTAQEIPPKFLENILLELRHGGLVSSQRGAEGGYWLARPAEEISLADVIRDAISMADSHSLKGDVEVSVDVPEALRPLQGDPSQLRQIFTNFLTNAFEAMYGTGRVEITAIALSVWRSAATTAASADSRMTVRIVPSTGLATAP